MQRYFLQNNHYKDRNIHIVGDDYHHIVRVMRMQPGDRVEIVFPDGKTAISEIVAITEDVVELTIVGWDEKVRELPVEVTIGISLLKKDNFDMVVQKGTELGASRFLPFHAERSVVKLDDKKAAKKLIRWQKIAKEAAEQSERNFIPDVEKPCSLEAIISRKDTFDFCCVAYEESGRNFESGNFFQTLEQMEKGHSILFLFGPEGGFSETEIRLLEEENFIFCGLGPRILRAETAPLYALSAISFYFENGLR